jgi:ADP-heptose:LPS heptosyltransferase
MSTSSQWKARALLAKITVIEVVRCTLFQPKAAYPLIKAIGDLFRRGRRKSALRFLLEDVGFSSYRLRCRLRLGRSSLKAFERLQPISEGLASYPDAAFTEKTSDVKILVIRDGAMGDVLMATPVIRELYKQRAPRVVIDVATKVGCVFLNSPYINQVIPLKELGRKVREYDMVLDLNGVYERLPKIHPVDAYARVALGALEFDKQLELFPSSADVRCIKDALSALGDRFLVIHCPNHDWPNRRIPRSRWRQIMMQVASQTGWVLVQVGTSGDVSIENCSGIENHLGRYSIHELSVLISNSRGFIGVDAGPAHIAAATNAPICVFYTCAHHETRKPLRKRGRFLALTPEIDCYGCLTSHPFPRAGYHCKRHDNACTDAFNPAQVASKILDFVKGTDPIE